VEQIGRIFALHQYRDCDGPELEEDFERVAVYADADGTPQHVARQLPSGAWTSKLGVEDDIEAPTLAALSDGEYGTVVKIMKRPRRG
jgi:hypothetical protein